MAPASAGATFVFNFDKEADWRVWDGLQVSDGWAQAVQMPDVSHRWPLTAWFRPGALPFDPSPKPPQPQPGPPHAAAPNVLASPEPAFIGLDLFELRSHRIEHGRIRPE